MPRKKKDITCPRCNSSRVNKSGHCNRKQRFLCRECKYQFTYHGLDWHHLRRTPPKKPATKKWCLRDPKGKIHRFKNLNNFVREHEELFEPTDLVWKQGDKGPLACNAAMRLRSLKPTYKQRMVWWKGWSWGDLPPPVKTKHRTYPKRPRSKKPKPVLTPEERREREIQRQEKMRKARAKHPRMQKDEKFCTAKEWAFIDPWGDVHVFRNLSHFVRTHPELFDDKDLQWFTRPMGSETCNAVRGLSFLRPGKTYTRGDWHGWTWLYGEIGDE